MSRLRAAGSVFAEDEAELLVGAADGSGSRLASLVARRTAGEPVETILGWADFRGHRITVTPGVFVPRRRTGLLVDVAISVVHPPSRGAISLWTIPVVVELCCGSGAVARAIATELATRGTEVEVHAADVDPVATACARSNLGGRGRVHTGDLYDALPAELRGRIGVVVANAPYVPTGEIPLMPTEARDHEPQVALDGGPDGLDVQRRIVADAAAWLAPGGHLVVETSRRQADGTLTACAAAGLAGHVVTDGDLDATAVVGRRP